MLGLFFFLVSHSMTINKLDKTRREKLVSMVARMFEEGLTSGEIATKLCISESTVRSIKKDIIDKAKTNGMK